MLLKFVATLTIAALVVAQDYDEYEPSPPRRPAPARIQPGYSGAVKPTPVAILKQINRHNEDGSYTYGYESADGSFKIETKLPTGEVKGKYGFTDDTGKVRVVEYGATKYGFEPSGEGITVPPPTIVDETTNKDGTLNTAYSDDYYEPAPAPRPVARLQQRPISQLSAYDSFAAQQPQQQYAPAPQQYAPAPQQFGPPSHSNFGPVPQRQAQIPGASLQTEIQYVAQTKPPASRGFGPSPLRPSASFSFQPEPAPIQEEENYAEPAPRPAPRITYAQPAQQAHPQFAPQFAPQARPQPQQFAPAPRPAAVTRQAGGGGLLDQLAKDYALPQDSGAPLHDISFGYY